MLGAELYTWLAHYAETKSEYTWPNCLHTINTIINKFLIFRIILFSNIKPVINLPKYFFSAIYINRRVKQCEIMFKPAYMKYWPRCVLQLIWIKSSFHDCFCPFSKHVFNCVVTLDMVRLHCGVRDQRKESVHLVTGKVETNFSISWTLHNRGGGMYGKFWKIFLSFDT